RLPPPAPLPQPAAARARAPRQPPPPRRRLALHADPRPPARPARRRPARALPADRSVSDRPLLRADHRLDRRRPLGPPPRRRRRALGEGRGDPLMPRAFDVAIAALALLVLSPILLIAAIAIKLSGRGPVIYRQRRVGRDGREFEMWKLRTMVQGSDPVGVGKVVYRDDPRVTAPGRLLRRTSLDEIPNFVNVLRGEMAI